MRREPDHAAHEAGRLLNRYMFGGPELRAELTDKLRAPAQQSAEAHAKILELAQGDYHELTSMLLGQCAAGENDAAARTARTIVALEEGARATDAATKKPKKKPE